MSDRTLSPPWKPMAVAVEWLDQRFTVEGRYALRHWRSEWWNYKTTHWHRYDDEFLRSRAYDFTHGACYEAYSRSEGWHFVEWAPTKAKINNLLDATAARAILDPDIDAPIWLEDCGGPPAHEMISMSNGLLHVPTRALRRHDHRLFNLGALPFAFDASASRPDRWLRFLDELWPEDEDSKRALQEFFGYVVSGRADLQKILLVVGPPRAGKGVLCTVLRALVGTDNCAGPTLSSLGQNFGLAPLIGKPLAIISDARFDGRNSADVVERLLSISGQDTLQIDRKHIAPWTGRLPTRFVVVSNELPQLRDESGAIATRFVVLQLSRSWLGREDPELAATLCTELPSIFNWALDGLDRLNTQHRFTTPDSSEDAIATLLDLASPFKAFLRDECNIGDFEVAVDVLYERWKMWCSANGQVLGSKQDLGKNLKACLPGIKRPTQRRKGDRTVRIYKGLTCNDRVTRRHAFEPTARELVLSPQPAYARCT